MIEAAQMLRRWRQRDSATLVAAWRRGGGGGSVSGGGGSAKLGGGAQRKAAARWQQQGGSGRFTGTVHECANARAFELHRRADVPLFVLGQGRRDDSADGIVLMGSNGGTRGDVHHGRQCAAAANHNANGDGNADVIVC